MQISFAVRFCVVFLFKPTMTPRSLLYSLALLYGLIPQGVLTQQCRYGQPQWTGEWYWNQRYGMGYDQCKLFLEINFFAFILLFDTFN